MSEKFGKALQDLEDPAVDTAALDPAARMYLVSKLLGDERDLHLCGICLAAVKVREQRELKAAWDRLAEVFGRKLTPQLTDTLRDMQWGIRLARSVRLYMKKYNILSGPVCRSIAASYPKSSIAQRAWRTRGSCDQRSGGARPFGLFIPSLSHCYVVISSCGPPSLLKLSSELMICMSSCHLCAFCSDGLFAPNSFRRAWGPQKDSGSGLSYAVTWELLQTSTNAGCKWCALVLSTRTADMPYQGVRVTVRFRIDSGSNGTTPHGAQTLQLRINGLPHSVYFVYTPRGKLRRRLRVTFLAL